MYSLVRVYLFYILQTKLFNILALLSPKQLHKYNASQKKLSSWWDTKLKEWGGYYNKKGWPVAIDIKEERWAGSTSPQQELDPSERKQVEIEREKIDRAEGLWLYNAWKSLVGESNILLQIFTIFSTLALATEYAVEYLSLTRGTRSKEYIRDLEDIMTNIFSILFLGWIVVMLIFKVPMFGSLFSFVCNVLLFLGGASILYGLIMNSIPTLDPDKPTWLALIINSIFYLPCLIHTTIGTTVDGSAANTLIILIIFEILLLYLKYVPDKLTSLVSNASSSMSTSVKLQSSPVYISKATDITDLKAMYGETGSALSYHFALSCDFWINPQPVNTAPAYSKFANIITLDGRPSVQYNSKLGKLRVSFSNENDAMAPLFETDRVPLQSWNNIVINYDGGTADIYLNGNLVSSVENVTPYLTRASLTIGENKGIAGAVKNVIYYKDNPSIQQIKANALL